MTDYRELAELCETLTKTKSKIQMRELIAAFLQRVDYEELSLSVNLIIGRVFGEGENRSLGMSFRSVFRVIDEIGGSCRADSRAYSDAVDVGEIVGIALRKAGHKSRSLKIQDVHDYFTRIADCRGKGCRTQKERLLKELLSAVDAVEAKYIVKSMMGEMRHGVSDGVMIDGVSKAAGVSEELVRRAHMFLGGLGEAATTALGGGERALLKVAPTLFRPIKPMLAQTADSVVAAWRAFQGKMAVEYKYDGARVQIHKNGDAVGVYSRRLTDITEGLPEVVVEAVNLPARRALLEGEVIGIDGEGRPLPFQHIMRRVTRVHDVGRTMRRIPVKLYLFDCLMVEDQVLVDSSYERRWSILADAVGERLLARRLIPDSEDAVQRFLNRALEEGHEGLMAKELSGSYTPGTRGGSWLKIKVANTVDLVILAADWGYGRRHGWLSNYHLGALDEGSGKYLPVGKTFKGLRDEEFEKLTRRLLSIQTGEGGGTVYMEPKVVVEVTFNEIQRSPHYSSGMALRFARVSRIRFDKSPDQVTTLKMLRELYEKEAARKGRVPGE